MHATWFVVENGNSIVFTTSIIVLVASTHGGNQQLQQAVSGTVGIVVSPVRAGNLTTLDTA